MIMQGNYHNLEGRKEGRKEREAVKEGETGAERKNGGREEGMEGKEGRKDTKRGKKNIDWGEQDMEHKLITRCTAGQEWHCVK